MTPRDAFRHNPAVERAEKLGTEWTADAACRGKDPDLFFPGTETGRAGGTDSTAQATCPVIEECLRYAMVANLTHGVWGGKSENQRRALRREQWRRRAG